MTEYQKMMDPSSPDFRYPNGLTVKENNAKRKPITNPPIPPYLVECHSFYTNGMRVYEQGTGEWGSIYPSAWGNLFSFVSDDMVSYEPQHIIAFLVEKK